MVMKALRLQVAGAGGPRPEWVAAVGVSMIGTFMAILDTFIVVVAMPTIRRDLDAAPEQLQWILAGYQLTYAGMLVTGGRLGDRFGRKRTFVTGMALFTVFSGSCALAPTAEILIVSRLLQGGAAAIMFPQVFAMISVLVPQADRAKVLGVLGGVIGVASISGQLLGGVLSAADLFGQTWQSVFWVNVPIGVIAVVLASRFIPETRANESKHLDLAGTAVLTTALFLVLIPLIHGRQSGWPPTMWASFIVGVLTMVGFVVIERRVLANGGDPLLTIQLFRRRPFVVGIGLIFVVYCGVSSFFLILSLMLQEGLGFTPTMAGVVYAPDGLAFLAASVLAGRLVPRYGSRVPALGACLIAVGVTVAMIVSLDQGGALTARSLIPALLCQGFGGGLLITPLMGVVLARIDPSEIGMASGVLSTTQQVGAASGVAVVGVIFFGSLRPALGQAASFAHAFAVANIFIVAVAALAAGLLFAGLLSSTTIRG
ncbi:MFS transporter [Nocardia sp. CDC160]|uniref:MFS transporter n=1 Tax=Nocardia sp. CDC160 TaxID=3112166 RepID=UPI002DBC735A|nr:MFS transporter [Nocardia sp. CDC160]MEC3919275.1 MFS transporter [Nocardia sp. CDC160]